MSKLIESSDLKQIVKSLIDFSPNQNIRNLNLDFSGKTVVVIGCAGFLGRIFLSYFDYLNKELFFNLNLPPVNVVGYDNFIVGESNFAEYDDNKHINIYHCDIIKTQPQNGLKHDEKVDFVLALQGIAEPRVYQRFPKETYRVSSVGTENTLEFAKEREAKAILTFSSSEVYNTPPPHEIPTKESYDGACPTMGSRSCYDIGKQFLEMVCHTYFTQDALPITIVRPFNIYSNSNKKDTRVLPNFIKSVFANEDLKVYGVPTNTRTFCHIIDGIQGFIRALLIGRRGAVYNIGNDNPEINMYDLACLVKKVSNYAGEVKVIPYPSNYPSTEPKRRCPDITKARTELKYNPTISLEQGITKFYNWAKENWK